MGRHVDRALVSGLLTGLFFCALRGFVRTIPVCMLFSFLFGAALYRLSRRLENRPRRLKRRRKLRAEAYLDALVMRQADEKALKSVLPENARILLRLPDSALSRDEVLSRWREAESPITLAATCAIPRQTAEFASSLPAPQVTLIGRGELIRRLAQPAVPLPDCSRSPRRPLRARLAQMLQKNRLGILGSCLYGGIMLCLYLLTGVGAYLIGSLSLIAIGGATFYVRRRS